MKKIVVVGSFVVDLMGRASHLPSQGETVKGDVFRVGPGGKGSNQAVAAKRLDADISLITKIGKDDFGQIALNSFNKENISTENIFFDDNLSTGAALIMVDNNTSQNKILVLLGACENITIADIQKAKNVINKADILLTQLEINVNAVDDLITFAHELGKIVILNPAPVQKIDDSLYSKIDIITPNEIEAEILTGIKVENFDDARKASEIFKKKGVKNIVITRGEYGLFVSTENGEKMIPAIKTDVLDTTGAGDSFNGAFATALAEGLDIESASIFANIAASLSVTKIGTAPSMPYRSEVDSYIKEKNINFKKVD